MKYVSPQTEKRKQQKRRRRKKLLLCAVLLCLAAIVAGVFLVLKGNGDRPEAPSDSQTESVESTAPSQGDEEADSDVSSDEKEEDSKDESSAEKEKPKKKKKSIVSRIKAIFAKTELIPVTFPATDNKEWVQIKAQDGTIYFMHMNSFIEIDSDGTAEDASEVFANLFLAG